jgi:hypothetical protein
MEANYIDGPTILIWAFWLGFAFLILYIRREDKREGYPLDSDRQGVSVQGFPAMPEPRAARVKHPALVANPQAGTPGAGGSHVISDTVYTDVLETEDETVVRRTEVIKTEDETIVVQQVEVTEHDEDNEEDA